MQQSKVKTVVGSSESSVIKFVYPSEKKKTKMDQRTNEFKKKKRVFQTNWEVFWNTFQVFFLIMKAEEGKSLLN